MIVLLRIYPQLRAVDPSSAFASAPSPLAAALARVEALLARLGLDVCADVTIVREGCRRSGHSFVLSLPRPCWEQPETA